MDNNNKYGGILNYKNLKQRSVTEFDKFELPYRRAGSNLNHKFKSFQNY